MECTYYKSWALTPHWPVFLISALLFGDLLSVLVYGDWTSDLMEYHVDELRNMLIMRLVVITDAKLIKYLNLCKGTQWMILFTLHRYWIPKKSDTPPHGDQPNHLHVFLVYNEKHTSWSFHGVWIKAALRKLEDDRFTCLHKLICLFLSNYGSYLMLWLLLF